MTTTRRLLIAASIAAASVTYAHAFEPEGKVECLAPADPGGGGLYLPQRWKRIGRPGSSTEKRTNRQHARC